MNNSMHQRALRVWRGGWKTRNLAAACLLMAPLYATPPFGFVSQTFRGRITANVGAHRWDPDPLFTLLIQSSNEQWGIDVVQGTTEFAAMDGMGRPSQSGWHDHPTALSIGLVIQGTVWSHAAGGNCLRPYPAGSVFFERSGEIHNNYNLDPRTPAVVRIIHFVDRNQAATRRDQPDPATGSATTAAPPPLPCPAEVPAGSTHPGHADSKTVEPSSMNLLAILAGVASSVNGQPVTLPFGIRTATPQTARRPRP